MCENISVGQGTNVKSLTNTIDTNLNNSLLVTSKIPSTQTVRNSITICCIKSVKCMAQ